MSYPIFKQGNYNIELGTGQGITIKMDGCAECDLTSICVWFGKQTDPVQLNQALINVGGYADNGSGQHSLLDWSAVTRIYPDITLAFNNRYPSQPAEMNLIDSQLDKQYPVIVGVSFTHNTTQTQPDHYVTLISKNADETYQCYDPWYGDITSFNNRYAVNGMSAAQCILQAVSYNGTPTQTQATGTMVSVDGAKFTQLVTKSTAYDAFVAAGYHSPADIQTTITNLTQARDTNLSAYNGEIEKNKELTEQASKSQEEVNTLGTTNTGLKQNILEVQKQNTDLLGKMQEMSKSDSTAIEEGLKAENRLKQELLDRQTFADALGAKDTTTIGILTAINDLKTEIENDKKIQENIMQLAEKKLKLLIDVFIRKKK